MDFRLELHDVHKVYEGDVHAVRGVSLELARGEFVSLLGPSGCGKSTTLSMISGFEAPTRGEIRMEGKVVNRIPVQRRRIGLVFQDYAVFSRMSVRANLAFGLQSRRMLRARRRELVERMAERLDLTGILDRRGDSLNMSEMQRVALGRVLVTEPELLLLDEPMSNLDAALRASLRTELKQIQRGLGQTVLYVTHDQIEAMSMSDRIAIMDGGEILQFGTPEEIYDRPRNRFVAEFIGDPPINVVGCELFHRNGMMRVRTDAGSLLSLGPGSVAPGAYLLAIRPHDVVVGLAPGEGGTAGAVRYVENLGAEHVLHVEYGADMVRAVVPPGTAGEGTLVHLSFPAGRVHLIDPGTGETVPVPGTAEAA